MPAWFLNPALTRFRNEVNDRWPNRDKASDGTIGDLAHQATSSDHNPDPDGSVDAWDMDNDGVPVDTVIAAALKHESIQYIIWNRRITSRSWGLGTWHPYSGVSPHTEHVHFNTREGFENSSKPWFTEEEDMGEGFGFRTQDEANNMVFRITAAYSDVRTVVIPKLQALADTIATIKDIVTGDDVTLDDIKEEMEALTAQLTATAQADVARDLANASAAAAAIAEVPGAVLSALAAQPPADLLDALEDAMTPAAFQELLVSAASR